MDNIAAAAPAPIRILIAEDSPTQAQRLRFILEQQGYVVSIAVHGKQALEMAAVILPAMIISDVVMPEMDGYELTGHIKANNALRHIPVILVTTLSDPEDVIRGLECGADSFVLKPYDEHHLIGRVQFVLINREISHAYDAGKGVEIFFNHQRHYITADRLQILNLLLSTYDAAMQRNQELRASKHALERRSAEVQEGNRFLDSVIENIPVSIFMKDATDLRYVRLNRAAEQLLGYSRNDMLDKNDFDFFPTEEAESFRSNDREVLARGTIEDIPEERVHTRDKGVRIRHTRKVPVFDGNGHSGYLLGISEDVTEQKEMEKLVLNLNSKLAERASDLEASNKGLERFAASASHDLRSPLSVIDGYASLLDKKYGDQLDEQGKRYLSVIRSNAQRMSVLIDDLLAFSRLARQTVNKGDVDMDAMVRQVVEDALQHRQDGGQIDVEIGSLPPAQADAGLIRQVWANLISNAVKYTSKSTRPRIEIKGSADGAEYVYSVRDNGAGFNMEHYGRLFEMFERLHSAEEYEGTGVGLPIVQQIVVRHGGRVWAEGDPGNGAVFYFALPHGAVLATACH